MKDILSEIIANKRFEVDLQKQAISIEQLQEGIHSGFPLHEKSLSFFRFRYHCRI